MHKVTASVSLRAFTLVVLLGCLWFYASSRSSEAVRTTRFVVAEQPGSPLLILLTGQDSSNPLEPKYWYSITNATDKAVSAYAIQESVTLGAGSPIVGTGFVHFPAAEVLFQPHASRQEAAGIGKAYQRAPVEIVLTVDFVEFADGSRWGDDIGKSGERLDGLRAGGKAAITKYRGVLLKEGVTGLESALAVQETTLMNAEDVKKSADWRDGFNSGENIVKSRLTNAKVRGGLEGVREELDKPFDSKGGRLKA
jgi:hypothetical protein